MPQALTATSATKRKTSSAEGLKSSVPPTPKKPSPRAGFPKCQKTPRLRSYVPLKYYQVLQRAKIHPEVPVLLASRPEPANSGLQAYHLLWSMKFHWDIATPIVLYIVCDWFCAAIVESRGCNRDLLPAKANIFTV